MTISYNWLCDYLPEPLEPEKLSRILTSIGLEVESLTPFETIKGGLAGLVIGEVITCEKHPDADKLSVTQVSVGAEKNLQIVCGAPNVAAGQKVVVATVGAKLFPFSGGEILIKNAKIRGVESAGMICAEDEIGLGDSHAGIMVLKTEATVGAPAASYFSTYSDWVFEIGLTPNRMDAMSHLGVARDVCAYLSHHEKMTANLVTPFKNNLNKPDKTTGLKINVELENAEDCQRYSGLTITGITIQESPVWLQNKLKSIGLRPINNVVDITNFILHETGQPLHAFDADKIEGKLIRVKNLPQDTPFITLDDKERKLDATDLMICDGASNPLCIGGVYGGKTSGVTTQTTNLFLESAWFNPISIRKSLVRHDLRTDAAVRFEKGVDISQTLAVLKRAALMIKELAGGEIVGPIIDLYPNPREKNTVSLKFHYLKKLSGKNYHPDTVRNILESLNFSFIKEGANDLWFEVPFSKPDVTLPADVVEEIMRIDGLDNVEIPAVIAITPSPDPRGPEESWKEKISQYLVGLGLHEMLTNSITNSKYYADEVLNSSIKMMNNLSADLNLLRPSMLETGLEVLAHNLNRRNNHLHLFEFGKTYASPEAGKYTENTHCVLFLSGNKTEENWRNKPTPVDFYYLKGLVAQLLQAMGLKVQASQRLQTNDLEGIELTIDKQTLVKLGKVSDSKLQRFDIKQPVFFADLNWEQLVAAALKNTIEYRGIPRFPAVQRDLAIVVDQLLHFEEVEKLTKKAGLDRLVQMQLFDVFESEKLGAGKKSLAINFVFQDKEKTMNDKEIDQMMQTLASLYETELGAQVRKG